MSECKKHEQWETVPTPYLGEVARAAVEASEGGPRIACDRSDCFAFNRLRGCLIPSLDGCPAGRLLTARADAMRDMTCVHISVSEELRESFEEAMQSLGEVGVIVRAEEDRQVDGCAACRAAARKYIGWCVLETGQSPDLSEADEDNPVGHAVLAENVRWQHRLNWVHTEYGVDGSGCDSGDPLDLVNSEVRQLAVLYEAMRENYERLSEHIKALNAKALAQDGDAALGRMVRRMEEALPVEDRETSIKLICSQLNGEYEWHVLTDSGALAIEMESPEAAFEGAGFGG